MGVQARPGFLIDLWVIVPHFWTSMMVGCRGCLSWGSIAFRRQSMFGLAASMLITLG